MQSLKRKVLLYRRGTLSYLYLCNNVFPPIYSTDKNYALFLKLDDWCRLNEDELHIFHDASGGDFAKFLSSVEKTIQWRRKYTMLSQQELDDWGNLVFWHGSDVMQRPTLVIRIGLAGSTLDSDDQAKFARAVGM